jgi:selenoprotein W-related protein
MQEFGVDSTLTPGGGGVFEVIVDGKNIFSKKSVGRFPETGEIVSMLQKR